MFHSKISGKKKLCLDSQVLVENKAYQSSFTYSFRIDQTYFNMVQLNNTDKFELRIDNQSFDNLIKIEKAGKLKEEKNSGCLKRNNNTKIPKIIPQISKPVQSVFGPKNDTDFDFFNSNDNSHKDIINIKNDALLSGEKAINHNIDLFQFYEEKPEKVADINKNTKNNGIYAQDNNCFQQQNQIERNNKNINQPISNDQLKLEMLQKELRSVYEKEHQPNQEWYAIFEMPNIDNNQSNVNKHMNMPYYPTQQEYPSQISLEQQSTPQIMQNPPLIKTNLNININNYPLTNHYYKNENQQLNIQAKTNLDPFDDFFSETNDQQYNNQPEYQLDQPQTNYHTQIKHFFSKKPQSNMAYMTNNSNQPTNQSTPFDF